MHKYIHNFFYSRPFLRSRSNIWGQEAISEGKVPYLRSRCPIWGQGAISEVKVPNLRSRGHIWGQEDISVVNLLFKPYSIVSFSPGERPTRVQQPPVQIKRQSTLLESSDLQSLLGEGQLYRMFFVDGWRQYCTYIDIRVGQFFRMQIYSLR